MKNLYGLTFLFLSQLTGCAVLEDNGTRLAFALERASYRLLDSQKEEMVFEYLPRGTPGHAYDVHMLRSRKTEAPYGGYITVSGEEGGGTSYQGRYVYIPRELYVAKNGEATSITLRKVDGRIEVSALK